MWTAKIQQVLGLYQMRGEFSWILWGAKAGITPSTPFRSCRINTREVPVKSRPKTRRLDI